MLANQGKFRDRNPDIRTAGKLTAGGDHTTNCLDIPPPDKTPALIEQLRAMTYPGPGEKRQYVGKYANPEVLEEMRHGLQKRSLDGANSLVNPTPQSLFQRRIVERKEMIYDSHAKKPLGKVPDQEGKFTEGVTVMDTFGIKTIKSVPAGLVVNPKISRSEVQDMAEQGIDLYKKSHAYSHVGEQKDLNYNWSRVKKTDCFGVETPHNNDGAHTKNCMKWSDKAKNSTVQTVVSKRLDDFKERTQPKLGEVHDPIKDSMKISSDHTFGVMNQPDEYGAGDLIHHREAVDYLRARDRHRGAVAAIRDHLKKANYHNFKDLRSAFNSYDKNASGKIEADDLMRVCKGFHLPVDDYLLDNLIGDCDSDGDSKIDYLDFCNFLNWTYDIPAEKLEKISEKVKSPSPPSAPTRQIDGNIGDHHTSSSVINAIAGVSPTSEYRAFGVPTIRSDLPAPRIKRVGDMTNYGEQSDVYGLVNPSLYTSHGLTEKDFFQVRPRADIAQVLRVLGVNEEDFENIYTIAGKMNSEGLVSVDSCLQVLRSRDS